MHRLKSQKNWAAGENIGEERTWYQLKIAFLKDCLNLWRVRPLSRVSHTFLANPFAVGLKTRSSKCRKFGNLSTDN